MRKLRKIMPVERAANAINSAILCPKVATNKVEFEPNVCLCVHVINKAL